MNPLSDPAQPPAGSRIISAEALQGVAAFDLNELAAPAREMRKLTSRDLTNDVARAAYEMGRKRGFDQGSRQGLTQGYSEGSQALEEFQSRTATDVSRQMQQLVDGFRGEMKALESQVASDLVSLAIDIARQVLRRELAHDPASLLPAAREALRALGEGASHLCVHLNPADAAAIGTQLEAVSDTACRIVQEPSMPRGSCRVEADTGVADASFETRWQAVMATLGRDEEPLP